MLPGSGDDAATYMSSQGVKSLYLYIVMVAKSKLMYTGFYVLCKPFLFSIFGHICVLITSLFVFLIDS